MTHRILAERTGESNSFCYMHRSSDDHPTMEHDVLLMPAMPYIDVNELVMIHGSEESFTSFTHPDPEVMALPASSNVDSPTSGMSHVSVSLISNHELNEEHSFHRLKQTPTRHPLKNISASEQHKIKKHKTFTKWSNAETNTLISAVNKHGLKWSKIKHDSQFKHVLIQRSNVDLKDKWRNIIVKDFKENFSFSELDNFRGPTNWLTFTKLVAQAIDTHKYKIGNWKRLSCQKRFNVLSKLGEVEILTIYRSHLNVSASCLG